MSDIRVMMLWVAVHLAALSFGAWAVMGSDAALFPMWVTSGLLALSIPPRWLGLT
jgi:hypothetical protein